MSGDSPNAFSNDHVFDYHREGGRSSPMATTSKDLKESASGVTTTASVLVEPPKSDATGAKDEEPDLASPIHNNVEVKERPDGDKSITDDKPETTNDSRDRERPPGKDGRDEEDGFVTNGIPDKMADRKLMAPPKEEEEDLGDDDACIVNCIYYTMECCKCTIM